MLSGRKVCKKRRDGWFLDADHKPDSHQNIKLLLSGPFTMFLKICMQIHSVVCALRRKINKQKVKKYAKTINLLWADNKMFVTYQS